MSTPETSGERRERFKKHVVASDHEPRGSLVWAAVVNGPSYEAGRILITGDQDWNIRTRGDAKVAFKIAPSRIAVEWENKTLCAHRT